MPAVANMSHVIPSHVLRVGQTVRLDRPPEPQNPSHPDSSSAFNDPELDVSLEALNQLILELDPTFEPLLMTRGPASISSYTGETTAGDNKRV